VVGRNVWKENSRVLEFWLGTPVSVVFRVLWRFVPVAWLELGDPGASVVRMASKHDLVKSLVMSTNAEMLLVFKVSSVVSLAHGVNGPTARKES